MKFEYPIEFHCFWMQNFSYKLIYYKYMYSIFLAVGPLVVLVILTLCIIGVSVVLKKSESGSSDTIALVSFINYFSL